MKSLHLFNPGHETAILNESPYYTLPANPLKMQSDLAYLPAWYASPDDWVWTPELLPEEFCSTLKKLQLPAKAVCKENIIACKPQISGAHFIPWGLSPQSVYQAQQWNREYDLNLQLPEWKAIYKELCSRKKARECLENLIQKISGISSGVLPQFYSNVDDIKQFIGQNKVPLLVKAPYSSSGRGLLWILDDKLGRSEEQILNGMLKKQDSVSIEKVLDKQLDFAMEFYIDGANRTEFKGYSLFQTDSKGAYEKNFILSQTKMETQITSFVDIALIEKAKCCLLDFLNRYFSPHYKGYVGVDMMVYKDNDVFMLHPCVEINMRNNMGLLSLYFHQRFCMEKAEGFFQIDFYPEKEKALQNHLEMQALYPLTINNGRISSGYLSLCPVTKDSKFRAYVLL